MPTLEFYVTETSLYREYGKYLYAQEPHNWAVVLSVTLTSRTLLKLNSGRDVGQLKIDVVINAAELIDGKQIGMLSIRDMYLQSRITISQSTFSDLFDLIKSGVAPATMTLQFPDMDGVKSIQDVWSNWGVEWEDKQEDCLPITGMLIKYSRNTQRLLSDFPHKTAEFPKEKAADKFMWFVVGLVVAGLLHLAF